MISTTKGQFFDVRASSFVSDIFVVVYKQPCLSLSFTQESSLADFNCFNASSCIFLENCVS